MVFLSWLASLSMLDLDADGLITSLAVAFARVRTILKFWTLFTDMATFPTLYIPSLVVWAALGPYLVNNKPPIKQRHEYLYFICLINYLCSTTSTVFSTKFFPRLLAAFSSESYKIPYDSSEPCATLHTPSTYPLAELSFFTTPLLVNKAVDPCLIWGPTVRAVYLNPI